MKKLILTALLIMIIAGSPKAGNNDSVYRFSSGQLLGKIQEIQIEQRNFNDKLSSYQGKALNENGIRFVTSTQEGLQKRIEWLLGLYDYFPNMSDEFRRELNYTIRDQTINGQWVKNYTTVQKGSKTNYSWLINIIKPVIVAQFPYLESIIDLFFGI
jgi:hypothetical protein